MAPSAEVSQVTSRVLGAGKPDALVSQVTTRVLLGKEILSQVSQVTTRVLMRRPTPCWWDGTTLQPARAFVWDGTNLTQIPAEGWADDTGAVQPLR